jgi:hypothetical protein
MKVSIHRFLVFSIILAVAALNTFAAAAKDRRPPSALDAVGDDVDGESVPTLKQVTKKVDIITIFWDEKGKSGTQTVEVLEFDKRTKFYKVKVSHCKMASKETCGDAREAFIKKGQLAYLRKMGEKSLKSQVTEYPSNQSVGEPSTGTVHQMETCSGNGNC